MKFFPVVAAVMAAGSLTLASNLPSKSEKVAGGKKGWWEATARYPVFKARTPVLNLATSALKANARKLVAAFLKDAPTFVYQGKPDPPFVFDSDFTLFTASPNLVSIRLKNYQDVHGAHPSFYYQVFCYGIVKGKARRLKLQDLFKPGVHAESQMNAQLMPILRAKHLSFIDDGTVKKLSHDDLNSFAVVDGGLKFIFSPYEIASWAEGPQEVDLKFSDIKGLDPMGPLKDRM